MGSQVIVNTALLLSISRVSEASKDWEIWFHKCKTCAGDLLGIRTGSQSPWNIYLGWEEFVYRYLDKLPLKIKQKHWVAIQQYIVSMGDTFSL